MSLWPSASQTVGPYFRIGLDWMDQTQAGEGVSPSDLVIGGAAQGSGAPVVTVTGRVFDGLGVPVNDGLLEIWRPGTPQVGASDASSDSPMVFAAQQGFGRVQLSPEDGTYLFKVVAPTAQAGQAPHLVVMVLMRGLLRAASTRLYFLDGSAEGTSDPVLSLVPQERQATLIAQAKGEGQYGFDIQMQGDKETVFFNY